MQNGRFQIFLRKRQNVYANQDSGSPLYGQNYNVIVQCDPLTGWSQYVPGNVDNTWYDFTDYIEDAEKISLSWDKVNSGNSTNSTTSMDGSNYDKGITSDLLFFDKAYRFIYDHLFTTECDILNAVEVKIVDLVAEGTYRIFEIKSDNIEEAPIDEPCQFRIKLREQDYTWACIYKTFIFDNWQHWFENSTVKKHPTFLTCIEPRPRLVNSARMGLTIFFNTIKFSNPIKDARKILNADKFVDAPLIRTYIENVAGKCGLTMDTVFDVGQKWENLCLYFPSAGFMYESDSDSIISPSQAYQYNNRWLITISDLFDYLKEVFAAEWYVTPGNKIVFKYTKDLINLDPIYDFSANGAEPIYGIIYTFNGDKKPAYGDYEYMSDGADLASQEMSTLYNDIVDFDGPAFNPMLEGNITKNLKFAPTGFVRDGRSKDYMKLLINDGKAVALILLAIFGIIASILWANPIALGVVLGLIITFDITVVTKYNELISAFVDNPIYSGAVRTTIEAIGVPRLLLWDGKDLNRAKVLRMTTLPKPNPFYNPKLVPYTAKNSISTDNPGNIVYNYPLYFDGDFTGNLFDQYHDEIDNPLKSKESHREVKFYVDLCTAMLNLFGVFENQYAVIGKVVIVEKRDNYDIYCRIGNINVDYDQNRINIKGVILRRKK